MSLLAASGASCPRRFQTTGPQAPVAFREPPAIQQIIATVNANTQRVQRMTAEGATISAPGIPTLKTQLALERPSRLRMISSLGFGEEVDLGSNDELFWFWAKRGDPAVFYARHADVANGATRRILPMPPSWLIEAIGLVQLDPNGQWDGPHPHGQGRLKISTRVNTSSGPLTKLYVIDDQRGLILEQHVYDPTGQLLATAMASAHAYNATNQVTLPRRVNIQLPAAESGFREFTLEVDGYTINALEADPGQLWTMPQKGNTPAVPLASVSQSGRFGPSNAGRNELVGFRSGDEFMAR